MRAFFNQRRDLGFDELHTRLRIEERALAAILGDADNQLVHDLAGPANNLVMTERDGIERARIKADAKFRGQGGCSLAVKSAFRLADKGLKTR